MYVSIPLSEFCWLKQTAQVFLAMARPVSIPLSEFCWLKPERQHERHGEQPQGFNSPIGILLVEAGNPANNSGSYMEVSIPLSEFCWLKRIQGSSGIRCCCRFNSPIGILLVEASSSTARTRSLRKFQFPYRNSVG